MKVPPRIAKRKTKVLRAELQMLQKYKTEASLLLDEYKMEYIRDMSFLEDKFSEMKDECAEGTDNPESLALDSEGNQEWKKTEDGWKKEEDEIPDPFLESVDKPETPDWAKKLYRKIALVSHPDRMSDDFSKDKLKKIFLETANAMDQGDFEKLLGFALELGIEDEHDDVSMLPLLAKRVADVKKEIQEIEKSPEWLWGEGLGVPEIRASLAMIFFARRGIDLNTEELAAIIQEMEKSGGED